MKTCPECAESVQDAAKKCRFCGYRFDAPPEKTKPCPECAEEIPESATVCELCGHDLAAPAAAAAPAVPAPAAAPAPPAATVGSRWPFVAAGVGGILVGLGALVWTGFLVFRGLEQTSTEVARLIGLPLAAGSIVLAVGWAGLRGRGIGGIDLVFGALAIPVGFLIGFVVDADVALRGLIAIAGILAFAGIQYAGLSAEPGLEAARGAAALGLIGLLAMMLALVGKINLPDWLATTAFVVGIGGVGLYGVVLAFSLLGRRD